MSFLERISNVLKSKYERIIKQLSKDDIERKNMIKISKNTLDKKNNNSNLPSNNIMLKSSINKNNIGKPNKFNHLLSLNQHQLKNNNISIKHEFNFDNDKNVYLPNLNKYSSNISTIDFEKFYFNNNLHFDNFSEYEKNENLISNKKEFRKTMNNIQCVRHNI